MSRSESSLKAGREGVGPSARKDGLTERAGIELLENESEEDTMLIILNNV